MADGNEKKFSITGLIPKTADYNDSTRMLNDHIDNMLAEMKKQPLPQSRKCLRDGDQTGKLEMAGHWTISASEREQPKLRGAILTRVPARLKSFRRKKPPGCSMAAAGLAS
jgi:hypothetical protein